MLLSIKRLPRYVGIRAGIAAAVVLATGPAPRAQTAPPPSAAADPTGIWTIQDENASISTSSLTDRFYVNGLRLGYTTGTDGVPAFLQGIGRAVFGDGQQRFSFDLSQQIFTPADTSAKVPPPNDRPYAGVLLGNFGLITDTATTRSTLGASIGLIGPWALGEEVQNGFHGIIGQTKNNGWKYQLKNEPAAQFLSARVWRLPMGRVVGLETDALPELEAGLGTVRIYAQTGVNFRLGQGLDSDFGAPRVRPGPSGGDAFKPTRPFAWYVFGGADGQAVAHDVTLDGNNFQSSPSVKLLPFVGEFQGGLGLMAYGARLTYTQVVQTQEFKHQKGGPHQFGSVALSVRF